MEEVNFVLFRYIIGIFKFVKVYNIREMLENIYSFRKLRWMVGFKMWDSYMYFRNVYWDS